MKKNIFYFAALLFLATACQKEDIENTATVSMAGQWYCTVDAVDQNDVPIHVPVYDDNGNIERYNDGEDYFGLGGRTLILAYNTAGNTSNEMWIDNMGIGNFSADYQSNLWDFIDMLDGDIAAAKSAFRSNFPCYTLKTKVVIDQNTMTFRSTESENVGDGYQWWVKVVDRDEKGDTIWADDDKTEPQMVDSLFHEVKSMPVTIEGKILKGAGRQNNGSVADSIVFFVTYKDDPWYPADGYTRYKVSGIRYSGLVENE